MEQNQQNEKLQQWKNQISSFLFPRWNELPEVDLYMDQVVGYLSQKLSVFYDTEDEDSGKMITATMINNYVKQRIIAAPVKKRYDRSCVSALIVLFCLKQVLSIGSSGAVIAQCRWNEDPAGAYDRFCHIFETVLHRTVSENKCFEQDVDVDSDPCLSAVAIAFTNKLYAEKIIQSSVQPKSDVHTEK